jgi:hypothetical protein
MNDAPAKPAQSAIDYMVRVLQMNPVQQCDQIVDARSAIVGQGKKPGHAKSQEAGEAKFERRNLLAELDSLRAGFWSLPPEVLETKLTQLSGRGYADLDAAVARLRVVATHRDEFPKLADKLGFDRYIVDSLKEILTKSPRDVALLKEHELAEFHTRSQRKRGRKIVKLIKRELPAIYELEADWFDAIYKQKATGMLRVSANGSLVGSGTNGRAYWWVIFIAVSALGRVLLMLPGGSDSRTNSSRIPHYTYEAPPRYTPPSYAPQPYTLTPYTPGPFVPNGRASESQRGRESQGGAMFGNDKDVWKPYETPDDTDSRLRGGTGDSFARPKIFEPNVPANKSDDRYSR